MSSKPPEVRFCWEVALKFIVKMDCYHDAGCSLDKEDDFSRNFLIWEILIGCPLRQYLGRATTLDP